MNRFEELLTSVRHPGRYLGTEVNAVSKSAAVMTCRVALAFPDLYEVAMSYLGYHVLYERLNREPDLWAERVFAPDTDLEAGLKAHGLPLLSLESRTPLDQFDLVGFTLQHELNVFDVLAMLCMGRIPVRAVDRTDRHPLVIAGGPGAGNPEPLAEALDVVFLGDAEEAIAGIARTVGLARRRGERRERILDALMDLPGIYIPSRYEVRYKRDGEVAAISARAGAPSRIRRRLLPDLNQAVPPVAPVVPFVQAVHDRLVIEIQRGCTRGCRFCQAGMINRPVRCRTAPAILSAIDQGLCATGFDQVALLSLSAADHPQILPLLEEFFRRFGPRRVSASLPSLRADTLSPRLAALVRTVRKSGFTIAPEAGTPRLRRVIQKDLTDQDVIQAALEAFRAGWQLLKLYFMVGLPTETAQDREGIIEMVARIRQELRAAGFRSQLNVGISLFVPKPHTPFQWEAMMDRPRGLDARERVAEGLRRIPGVKVGWTQVEASWTEGLLSRGDRRLFAALGTLQEQGQRLGAWSEHLQADRIERAFTALDLPGGPEWLLRARRPEEILPWDHLDFGPSKAFLLDERNRAYAGLPTPDCARGECSNCGACQPESATPVLGDFAPLVSGVGTEDPAPTDRQERIETVKIRLRLAKRQPASALGHLEFMSVIERALRRADWPLQFSLGFHPKPRLSFGPACPLGVESLAEYLDVTAVGSVDLPALSARLRQALPQGIELLEAQLLPPGAPSIMKQAVRLRYRLRFDSTLDPVEARRGAQTLLDRQSWPVARPIKGRTRTLELRPSVWGLEVKTGADGLEALLELSLEASAMARPGEVAREAFGRQPKQVIRELLVFGIRAGVTEENP